MALACRRADMLLCPSTLEYRFIISNLQILKAFNVVGDFFSSPFDGPAPDNPVLGANKVLGGAPYISQKDSNANTGIGFVLVALVGLADEPDRLGKSKHEVSALVSSDALIGSLMSQEKSTLST